MWFPLGTFVMSILFGILLPVVDIVSDGYLLVNTMSFNGKSLAMAGCRSCYDRESHKDYTKEKPCNVCAFMPYGFGGIYCGFYQAALDKMTELIENNACPKNEAWSIVKKHNSAERVFERQPVCSTTTGCCITIMEDEAKDRSNDINSFVPNSIHWIYCRVKDQCELCLGVGSGDVSSCNHMLKSDLKLHSKVRSCSEGYFAVNASQKNSFQKQTECGIHDDCCIHMKKPHKNSYYFRCNDVCRLHLDFVSMYSQKIYDYASWSTQTDYVMGMLVGGYICGITRIYGWCLLIPIFLNWAFVVRLWMIDYRKQKTSLNTFVFGLTMTYPMFLVAKYLGKWRNREQMRQQKAEFDRDVGTAEGYLESLAQVNKDMYTLLFLLGRLVFVIQYSLVYFKSITQATLIFISVTHILCTSDDDLINFSC